MTIGARPATIAHELGPEIDRLYETARTYLDSSALTMKRLWAKADKLAQADAVAASAIKANLCCLSGDLDGVLHWSRNIARLNEPHKAVRCEMTLVANLGYFSWARKLYPQAVHIERANLGQKLADGLVCGAIEALLERADQAAAAKLELDPDSVDAIVISRSCQAALRRADLSEDDLTALLDLAGEVMREQRVLWQLRFPAVHVTNSEEDVGVVFQLRVPVAPGLAAEMTDEVLLRAIDRGLDRPGLSFSFLPYPARDVHVA